MTHAGSCHCGRIAFELEGEVDKAIDCNCSMCRRRGALLAFFPREALRLSTPEADMATYTFNRHALQHRFCPSCGIAPFLSWRYPSTLRSATSIFARLPPNSQVKIA